MHLTRALVVLATAAVVVGCGGADPGEPGPAGGTPVQATPTVTPTLPGAPNPLWIAHRGGMGVFPESSSVAYRAAAQSGFALEVDLRVLGDGTVVVMHDPTVDRTTDGHGPVDSFTAVDWGQLSIDGDGGPPPTWKAFLDAHAGRSIIVAEVKTPEARQGLVDAVLERGIKDQVIAQSFDAADVEATAAAGIPSMLLVKKGGPKVPAGVAYVGCSQSESVMATCLAAAKAQGRQAAVWTVDSKARADAAIAEGVVAVFTNQPWLLTGANPPPRP